MLHTSRQSQAKLSSVVRSHFFFHEHNYLKEEEKRTQNFNWRKNDDTQQDTH
jgi:hypothetical protein